MDQFTPLLLLMAIGALGLVWRWSREGAEIALAACARVCRDAKVQLLDATVALSRVRWREGRFERCYRFEFSRDGNTRSPGVIWMRDTVIVYSALSSGTHSEILS